MKSSQNDPFIAKSLLRAALFNIDELFLEVNENKCNIIQVSESNCINSSRIYSKKKKLILKNWLITFAFSVTPCVKKWLVVHHTVIWYFNFFKKICLSLKYKIRLLNITVPKLSSFQKSWNFYYSKRLWDRAFLPIILPTKNG